MNIHRMPFAVVSPDDWRVHIRYVNWAGAEKYRIIAVQPTDAARTEEQAIAIALASLRKRGQYPPKIIDTRAVRRKNDQNMRHVAERKELIERLVEGDERSEVIRRLIRGG